MSSADAGLGVNMEGLRERLHQQAEAPVKAENERTASDAVKTLNEKEAGEQKDEKDKKTFGRTPDGTGAYKPETLPRWKERLECSNARGSIYTVTKKRRMPPKRARSSPVLSLLLQKLTLLMP